MSDGERYLVELEFKRIGDFGLDQLGAKLKRSEKGFDSFKKGWNDLRSSTQPLTDAFDGVARSAMGFMKMGAMAGGAALFAGATYGVANLNNELEKVTIGLGVIFNASGVASDVPVGIERAKNAITQMRRDAQRLPGEFSELQNIFTTAATPAFRNGASINTLEKLSAKAMVAGKVTNMDMGQVAREFTLLMEGRAGSHNTFGSKMGLTGDLAKQFNAMSGEKRFAELEKLLGKYEGGLSAFENTFDAQSSTLVDNLKSYAIKGTSSLFIHVKDTMKEANDWFTAHQDEATSFAVKWGSRLVSGFEAGKRVVQEYGPLLLNFTETAYGRWTTFWNDVQPYVDRFGDSLRSALSDPNGTIDKLVHLAELWAGMKVGGALVGGLANGGLNGGLLAGGAALGMYGVANSAMNGVSANSYVETVGGGAMIGSRFGGAPGAAVGAAIGAIVADMQLWSESSDRETAFREQTASNAEAFMTNERRWYSEHGFTQAEAETAMRSYAKKLQDTTMEIDPATGAVVGSIYGLAADIETASASLLNHADRVIESINTKADYDYGVYTAAQALKKLSDAGGADATSADKHKPKGGHGGTVQKVEIVVTQNAHPSRVARQIVGYIDHYARNSGRSPDVSGFDLLETQ